MRVVLSQVHGARASLGPSVYSDRYTVFTVDPGWLVTYGDCLLSRIFSPISALTRSDVEQLLDRDQRVKL